MSSSLKQREINHSTENKSSKKKDISKAVVQVSSETKPMLPKEAYALLFLAILFLFIQVMGSFLYSVFVIEPTMMELHHPKETKTPRIKVKKKPVVSKINDYAQHTSSRITTLREENKYDMYKPNYEAPPIPLTQASSGIRRPNIVFFLSDDHSAEAVGYREGARLREYAQTTHIDKLAREGATIEDYFVTLSLCSPSRASILTGVHAHTHQVVGLGGSITAKLNGKTYVDVLKRAGYATAIYGKWHLGSRPPFKSFDIFIKQGSYRDPPMNRGTTEREFHQSRSKAFQVKGNSSSIVGNLSVSKLKDWADQGIGLSHERPFLLHVHFKETHEPWNYPLAYESVMDEKWETLRQQLNPALKKEGHGLSSLFPEPITMNNVSVAGPLHSPALGWSIESLGDRIIVDNERGVLYGNSPLDRSAFENAASLYEKRKLVYDKLIADYLKTGKSMDDQIGLVLQELEDMGVAEDTLVIYSSDQGYFLGEHNCFDKRMMWEESLRAPAVLRYPRLIPAGLKVGKGILVTNVDWAPTLLEFAQIKIGHVPRISANKNVKFSSYVEEGELPPAAIATLARIKSPPELSFFDIVHNAGHVRKDKQSETKVKKMLNNSMNQQIIFHGRSFYGLLVSKIRTTSNKPISKPNWWQRENLFYHYYGEMKKPNSRPSHMGIRTKDGRKLVLYYSLRRDEKRKEQENIWEYFDMRQQKRPVIEDRSQHNHNADDLRNKEYENIYNLTQVTNSLKLDKLKLHMYVEMRREGFEFLPLSTTILKHNSSSGSSNDNKDGVSATINYIHMNSAISKMYQTIKSFGSILRNRVIRELHGEEGNKDQLIEITEIHVKSENEDQSPLMILPLACRSIPFHLKEFMECLLSDQSYGTIKDLVYLNNAHNEKQKPTDVSDKLQSIVADHSRNEYITSKNQQKPRVEKQRSSNLVERMSATIWKKEES